MLRFAEDACVQCGLCAGHLPGEGDHPRPAARLPRRDSHARGSLKEEEPFHCIRCGKPFGVKSTIERVTAKLAGKHWMFQNSAQRLEVLEMCADCRAVAITEQGLDPGARRGRGLRTTEDYLREREEESATAGRSLLPRRPLQEPHQRRALLGGPIVCSGILVPGV